MTVYKFSQRSLDRLKGIHPDLVTVVVAALYRYTTIDFTVIEGVRDIDMQKVLVQQGKSWTMNSKHLIQPDGFAHAVDLAPWRPGGIPWDDWDAFRSVAAAMKFSARYLQVQIVWGGDWKVKDGPHFQLGR